MKIIKGLILFFCGFTKSNAFFNNLNLNILPSIFEKNHEIYKHYDKFYITSQNNF